MGKKKATKKVIKRRLNIRKVFLSLLAIIIIGILIYIIVNSPIKNIYVIDNKILTDNQVIESAKLEDYPSFMLNPSFKIVKNLKKNPYIKDAKVKKKWGNKVYLYIIENRPLCQTINNELILLDGTKIENNNNLTDYPILINSVDTIYDNFVKNFALIDEDILNKISQIEYSPVPVDNERFVLYMNDGNVVYITLPKIEKINKYNNIYRELDGNKGIVYLDSGDYFEIKEKKGESNPENASETPEDTANNEPNNQE